MGGWRWVGTNTVLPLSAVISVTECIPERKEKRHTHPEKVARPGLRVWAEPGRRVVPLAVKGHATGPTSAARRDNVRGLTLRELEH